MKMEQTDCSKMLAIKLHAPENNPKEHRRHSKHSESLKSRTFIHFKFLYVLQPPTLTPSQGYISSDGNLFISENKVKHSRYRPELV
jgi:hypothetical protein